MPPGSIGDDTRVMVGHSLGSVVAYEALCAHPQWPVRALVTLGSPLGIRNLIFDRLVPAPRLRPTAGRVRGRGRGRVRSWVNVADEGDVVALVKDLRPLFGRGWTAAWSTTARSPTMSPLPDRGGDRRAIAAGLARLWSDVSRAQGQTAARGRRFLLTCAMTRYQHCADWDRDELAEDVARMVELFCGEFLPEEGRYEHVDVLGVSPTSGDLQDRLRDFCTEPGPAPR